MNIKKGDNVIIISGEDRNKTGKVVVVFPDSNKIVVEGINLKKRHQRKTKANQKGQIIDKAMPINVSKVMLVDPSSGKGTRLGAKYIGEKKVRISKRSGKEI